MKAIIYIILCFLVGLLSSGLARLLGFELTTFQVSIVSVYIILVSAVISNVGAKLANKATKAQKSQANHI